MPDHPDDHPDDEDDPFERAVAREQELRDEFDGAGVVRLNVDQLKRIVDEGIDADLVRDVLDLGLPIPLDEILDLIAEYAPEIDFFEALRGLGPVTKGDAQLLLENDVSPADVAALRAADLDLTFDDIVDLAVHGADPDVVARLSAGENPMTADQLRAAVASGGPLVTVGVNFHTGRTQQAWGAGRQRVAKDGRVKGVWFGSLRVLPGVRTEIDALVIGDLVVEQSADVTIRGTVTGDVVNRGGHVSVTGRVGGDVVDEP